MAPSLVAPGSFRATGGTSVTVTASEGAPIEGCLRIVFISCAAGRDIVTSTTGWQRGFGSSNLGIGSFAVFFKIHAAGDNEVLFNLSGSSSASAIAVHVVSIRGQGLTAPSVAAAGGSETVVVAPSGAGATDALLLTFHALSGNPATFTTPTGMSAVGSSAPTSGAGHNAATFMQTLDGSGATGTRSSTSSVAGNWRAASVVVPTRANSGQWWALLAG